MKLFLPAFIALFAVICATYGICVTDNIVFELVLTIIAIVGGGVLAAMLFLQNF